MSQRLIAGRFKHIKGAATINLQAHKSPQGGAEDKKAAMD